MDPERLWGNYHGAKNAFFSTIGDALAAWTAQFLTIIWATRLKNVRLRKHMQKERPAWTFNGFLAKSLDRKWKGNLWQTINMNDDLFGADEDPRLWCTKRYGWRYEDDEVEETQRVWPRTGVNLVTGETSHSLRWGGYSSWSLLTFTVAP